MVRKLILAAAAAALAALPVAGHAATPKQRVPAVMSGPNEKLVGLPWYIVFPVVIAALVALHTGGSNNNPASP